MIGVGSLHGKPLQRRQLQLVGFGIAIVNVLQRGDPAVALREDALDDHGGRLYADNGVLRQPPRLAPFEHDRDFGVPEVAPAERLADLPVRGSCALPALWAGAQEL
eukprot:CAMPEP_0179270920 /NCGR_PEP_ID=MMETSP0797-20121207/31711_1 /TAXON_ID=47934 /ORGANISM="Dinophysis acuminata, Strain DAEP01" /LENGTH=105 /DNA_ID=CAMNT_0020979261 /DNA_START=274 /DNA_END=587 /DNA_ORIENTATION=-